jgi:hypothetical protein
MTDTPEVLSKMFETVVKIRIDAELVDQMASVIDTLVGRLKKRVEVRDDGMWSHVQVALCGMLAHGWALGMNPYNNPETLVSGEPVEVRVSRDILASMDVLKSIRYVKKDESGRIRQALFEPSQSAKFREQIERILDDAGRKGWGRT